MSSPINMFTLKKKIGLLKQAHHTEKWKSSTRRGVVCHYIVATCPATERSYELFLLLACVLSKEAKTLDILHQRKIIYGNFQNTSLTFSSILPDDSNMQKKAFFLVKGFYLFT